MKVLVCDSGPIMHLLEILRIDLLLNLGEIYIPRIVKLEIESHLHKLPDSIIILKLETEEIQEAERIMKSAKLHIGEAQSFVLAKKILADMLLTDDSAARFFAIMNNMEVHGSLGIVLWNYFNEMISKDETRTVLHQLRKSSLWLTDSTFKKALDALED